MFLCAFALLASLPALAVTHAGKVHHTVHHYAVRTALPGHYQVQFGGWNSMFPGSHDMLVRQNEELDRLQLPRIADDYELMRYESAQELVPVNETEALKIAADLPENRRYCRPWTRDFLQDFTGAFYNEFHSPLQINSLVRTVEQQHRLRRWNRFAAPGSRRHGFHPPDWRYLRHVAPRLDLRAVRVDPQLSASAAGPGHG